MVSQGGDGLSPMSEKPDEGSTRVSRPTVDGWELEVKGLDGISGDRLTYD